MNSINSGLITINDKLAAFEPYLTAQTKELDSKGIRWFQYDSKKEDLLQKNPNLILTINIGGKKFYITLKTILNNPDNVFFNLIITEQWNIKDELFIDRSYTYFNVVISYLRNGVVDLSLYSDEEIPSIKKEAEYYMIEGLIDLLANYVAKIVFVSFEFSGEYRSGNQSAGTNNIDDLNDEEDRTMMKGICTGYPGWIIIELNREVEFEEIEIGGFRGNTNLYASSNGSGAQIMTSLDKTNWTTVGSINASYANSPYIHKVTSSRAKYLKFSHNSYIGIGYLRIVKS